MPASLSSTKKPTSFGGQPGSQSAIQPKQSQSASQKSCLNIQRARHSLTRSVSQPNQLLCQHSTGFQRSNRHELHNREGEKTETQIKINRKEKNINMPEYRLAFSSRASRWYSIHNIHSIMGWLQEITRSMCMCVNVEVHLYTCKTTFLMNLYFGS